MKREEVEFDVDVLVVGAGVSGSSLAFHLFKNHKVDSILLTECNPFVGGNVISKRKGMPIIFHKPKCFLLSPC